VPVKVNLHPWLSEATGGQNAVTVIGATIGECLDELNIQFPGIKEQILNRKGEVKSYVLILLSGQNTYPEELSTPVKDGDEISIVFAVDGG
jgi:molybdopterin synthase sulfur carrier subunit